MKSPRNDAASAASTPTEATTRGTHSQLHCTTPALANDVSQALTVAHQLVDAGVPVFVAKPNTHGPNGSPDWSRMGGYQLPTGWQHTRPDHSLVDAWRTGDALCAVMGHTVDGLDVDTHKGGGQSLDTLTEEGAAPKPYGVATTPSGGLHFLIAPTGCHSRDGFRTGLDLKAGTEDGGRGFLFIAPTVKPSKVTGELVAYRWDATPALEDVQASDATSALAAIVEEARAGKGPSSGTAPESTTDPTEVAAYCKGIVESIARELDEAASWDDGVTDDRGRGWERMVADAAWRLASVGITPGSGIDQAEAEALFFDLVPEAMQETDTYNATDKWRLQSRRAQPVTVPVRGPEAFGLSLPAPAPAPSSSDSQAGVRFLNAQSKFAYLLGQAAGDRHTYVHELGWLFFDGKRWRLDTTGRVNRSLRRLLSKTAAENIADRNVLKAVNRASTAGGQEGVLRIARTTEAMTGEVGELDADPYALNLTNGTLDLRTFELRPHNPADRITKVARASWSPGARWESSRWASFLAEVLPDEDVRRYVQEYVGLALIGEVLEHKLLLLTGTGRNGKGVFYGAVSWALGDYAVSAEPDLFMARDGAHPTGQMDLWGARWVIVSETGSRRKLDDATVKRLTGGDTIRARRMAKDFVEFTPSHTAAMVTNHLPRVSAEDAAMWARLRVVPFNVVVPPERQDPHLSTKLKDEADAVLAWAVEGLKRYTAKGLTEPDAVKVATESYREDNDTLADFLAERTARVTTGGSTITELHNAYTDWCRSNHVDAEGRTEFGVVLRARGFQVKRASRGNVVKGLRLNYTGLLQNTLSTPNSAVSEVPPVANPSLYPREIEPEELHKLHTPPLGASSQTVEQAAILARLTGKGAPR